MAGVALKFHKNKGVIQHQLRPGCKSGFGKQQGMVNVDR